MVTGTWHVFRERGSHVGAEFDTRIDLCEGAVGSTAVHHIAQYSYGTFDFSVDVLDRVDQLPTPAGTVPSRRRQEVSHLGRQLHFMMRNIGASLEKCDSGRVIRAIFDVGSGALLFFEIRPGEYLVGLTVDAGSVLAADMAMATAVTEIRGLMGLPGQSPGGFTPAPGEPGGLAPAAPDAVTISRSGAASTADDAFVPLASAEVTGRALDWVARFEKATCRSFIDTFEEQSFAGYFTNISRRRRRTVYQEIGAQFQALCSSVDRALHGVVGLRVRRTVLDVEQGALYFQRLGDDELVFGGTLAQARVQVSSEHFDDLVRRYTQAMVVH